MSHVTFSFLRLVWAEEEEREEEEKKKNNSSYNSVLAFQLVPKHFKVRTSSSLKTCLNFQLILHAISPHPGVSLSLFHPIAVIAHHLSRSVLNVLA